MFINHIYRHAAQTPDKLAVIDSGVEVTYGAFAQSLHAHREALLQCALPADGVIVQVADRLYHDWLILLALRSLGHTVLLGGSPSEIERLGLSDIAALVCRPGQTDLIDAFARSHPDCQIVTVEREIGSALAPDQLPALIDGGHFGDQIVYTSGTTGTNKMLRFDGNKVETAMEKVHAISFVGRSPDKNEVIHSHSFGPWTLIGYIMPMMCWQRGYTLCMDQRADWQDHFFDYPVTSSVLLTGLVPQLCKGKAKRPTSYPPCRIVMSGGFVDIDLIDSLVVKFGVEASVIYGGTEFVAALESIVNEPGDALWLSPLKHAHVEIVDEEDHPTPLGEEGILRVRLDEADPTEYLDNPDVTAKFFRDGFFYPGDMAVMREDGRIRILGRVSDVLNLGGKKISIGPVEQRAREILQVRNLCVLAVQVDDGAERVAVVMEGTQLPETARIDLMRTKFSQPHKVEFVMMEKLPRGENGMMKINRRAVMEYVRQHLAR